MQTVKKEKKSIIQIAHEDLPAIIIPNIFKKNFLIPVFMIVRLALKKLLI